MLTQMVTPEANVAAFLSPTVPGMPSVPHERAKRESGTTGKHSGGRADAAGYGNRVPQDVVQKCSTKMYDNLGAYLVATVLPEGPSLPLETAHDSRGRFFPFQTTHVGID
jgi:hypothetical protein